MLTDRPTSVEKTANTRPPSSARRTRLPRSATFAIGTDSASAAREREHERDGDAGDADAEVVGDRRRDDGERRAVELVDRVEAEEDEQRLHRSVAGEPVEPLDRVAERRGGPLGTRARPTSAAGASGSRAHLPPTGVGHVRRRRPAAGVGQVGHVPRLLGRSVATSASRLGTTMPRRRATQRSQRSRTRKNAPPSPPGSRSSTSEHADGRGEQPPVVGRNHCRP